MKTKTWKLKEDIFFLLNKYRLIFIFTSIQTSITLVLSYLLITQLNYFKIIIIYGIIWFILWWFFSLKMKRFKWYSFLVFSIFCSLCIFWIPTFMIDKSTFSLLTLIIYFLLWIWNTLLIRCFFNMLWEEKMISIWSIVWSIIFLFVFSFVELWVYFLTKIGSVLSSLYMIWSIIIVIWLFVYEKEWQLD